MKVIRLILFVLLFAVQYGCIKTEDHEDLPEITLVSPAPCDTIYFGVPFVFSIRVSDRDGLGNIKMDIHHNFGHHQHGDHEPCNMDEPKTAINPYFNEWIFALPKDKKDYLFSREITIPENGYDVGDYHFHIYVTDNIGYQSFTSLAVKLQ